MKYLSVCSGIEAASVAWHPLGWQAAAFSEIEAFPAAVLAHHWPAVPNLGDMTKFKEWPSYAINLLVGGTPCQSFSVAGLREGLADPRGNLTLTFLAIAAQYRPEWICWENVPGILSDSTGAFGALLGGLSKLGYGWAYRILDAQYSRVPQRRRRVFVVGCLGGWQRAAQVLFERHSLQGHSPPSRQAGKDVAPTLSARTKGGGGLGTDFDLDGGLFCAATGQAATEILANLCPTLNCNHEAPYIAGPLTAGMSRSAARMPHEQGALVPIAFALRGREGGAMPEIEGDGSKVGALRAASGGSSRDYIAYRASGNCGVMEQGNKTACLDTATDPNCHIIQQGMAVRRLTPRECERLQGFPDDYTLIPQGKAMAADTPRYKAIGNSMAVPVMRWIGERIQLCEASRPAR